MRHEQIPSQPELLTLVTNVCTYCGMAKKLTKDHVIPKCLFAARSNEGSLMAKSCADCNWHSDEKLLRNFFMVLDQRLYEKGFGPLSHPKEARDLKRFLETWSLESGQYRLYPEDKITRLMQK